VSCRNCEISAPAVHLDLAFTVKRPLQSQFTICTSKRKQVKQSGHIIVCTDENTSIRAHRAIGGTRLSGPGHRVRAAANP
jgi:hypothetical protein